MLADQQKLTFNSVQALVAIKDLLRAMADREGKREREKRIRAIGTPK